MYLVHFGLRERPFSNTPDPRFIYLGARHTEALAHLLYGVQEHGFVQLTGEIGTGKTTVCRLLLNRLPDGVDVALIFNPLLTPEELLASVCDELGVKYEGHPLSRKPLIDALYRHLLAAHAAKRRTVLIVDEAQTLGVEALEQLRLLTNLETEKQKLLQIILIGQPELIEFLGREELQQLSQRITSRYNLLPLAEAETPVYVRHRLALAGGGRQIFETGALREVHRLSRGVPRLINFICDRALLGAYAQRRGKVDRPTVRAAAREVLPVSGVRRQVPWRLVTAGALVLLAVGAGTALRGGAVARLRPASESLMTRGADASRPRPPANAVPAAAPSASSTQQASPQQPAPAASPQQPGPPASPEQPAPQGTPQQLAPAALAELLQGGELPADRVSAFANLFSRWRLEPHGWNDPCEAAASMGFGCVEAAGGWPKLRRLDLPAVLRLVTRDGKPHWAALVALEAETASLDFGALVLLVTLSEIDTVWDGRFEVLWQPPSIGARGVTPGSRGRPVVWLKQRLDALDGQPRAARGDTYDESLRARVLSFQRDQSLSVDGIAGVETLARLGSLVDQRIPSLARGGR